MPQAWPQHRSELEAIFGMTPGERRKLAERLWDQILGLPDFAPRAPTQTTVRPFSKVLEDFPGTQPREPSGALLQGLAYAYYRADAPNVTLEVRGSRTGSRRIGAVADVDGWSGSTLVLSIEVKDEPITENDLGEFNSFLGNLRGHGDATAIALAQGFTRQARADLDSKGLLVMDRPTMIANVALWDLRKQQVAMQALDYYLWRIEKDPALLARFRKFVEDEKLSVG